MSLATWCLSLQYLNVLYNAWISLELDYFGKRNKANRAWSGPDRPAATSGRRPPQAEEGGSPTFGCRMLTDYKLDLSHMGLDEDVNG
jgi:hypothetical protein